MPGVPPSLPLSVWVATSCVNSNAITPSLLTVAGVDVPYKLITIEISSVVVDAALKVMLGAETKVNRDKIRHDQFRVPPAKSMPTAPQHFQAFNNYFKLMSIIYFGSNENLLHIHLVANLR